MSGRPKSKRSYPRGRAARQVAPAWTSEIYDSVCQYMRGKSSAPQQDVLRVVQALTAYMKHGAPVAPAVPREIWMNHDWYEPRKPATPLVLWRGIAGQPVPAPLAVIPATCFSSFSFNDEIARRFARYGAGGGFLMRLEASRISRGTPWAWFVGPFGMSAREKNLIDGWTDEDEVLLPPGYFKVLRVTGRAAQTPIVDVAFTPQPRYVRRGAVPRTVNGASVTKTVGGHRLAIVSPDLAKNVARRAARRVAAGRS